jgi:hypothetical protein
LDQELHMKTLVIEHTAPFQGLPELVADAEGLFAREGLTIQWVNTNEGGDRDAHTDVLNPNGLDPFRSHGRLLEQGKADMYNPASGATIAACKTRAFAAASSAAAPSSPLRPSWCRRTL